MAIPSILTSPRALTNLEAVNLCLEALGDRRVSREDQTTNSIKACTSIGRALMSVQSMGYDFSVQRKVRKLPASTGLITFGTSTISVAGDYTDAWRSLILQGTNLFDLDRNTKLFPVGVPVFVAATIARPLTSLPAPASWFIAVTAAIDFVGGLKPDDPVLRILAQTQAEAKVNLENMDVKVRPGPLTVTSPHFARIRGRNRRR